eukprot:11748149-Alexandrium_andersonii.AAC.1
MTRPESAQVPSIVTMHAAPSAEARSQRTREASSGSSSLRSEGRRDTRRREPASSRTRAVVTEIGDPGRQL